MPIASTTIPRSRLSGRSARPGRSAHWRTGQNSNSPDDRKWRRPLPGPSLDCQASRGSAVLREVRVRPVARPERPGERPGRGVSHGRVARDALPLQVVGRNGTRVLRIGGRLTEDEIHERPSGRAVADPGQLSCMARVDVERPRVDVALVAAAVVLDVELPGAARRAAVEGRQRRAVRAAGALAEAAGPFALA